MIIFKLLLGLNIALQIADYWTSYTAIKKGASEANPIVRKLIDKLGLKFGLLLAKATGIALAVWLYTIQSKTGLAVMAVLYVYVIFRNYKILKKKTK